MIEHRPDRASPWRAVVYGPGGARHSRSFRRKVDAEAWEAAVRTDMRRGDWVDPHAGDITLTGWLHSIPKLNVSETWRQTRLSLIGNHVDGDLGLWQLNRLTPEALQQWVTTKAETLAPETVRKLYAIVNEGLELAVARGRLVRSPAISVELPKPHATDHRYLTAAELDSLAEAIEARYKPFVLLCGYGGLRPGEAIRSEFRDLTGQFLNVRGTKTKTSKRKVRLPAFVVDELHRHRTEFPHVRLILHTQAGTPVDGRRLRARQFARAVRLSVGEPMRPYDLRHTHVALLIEQGAHPKVIADRLGHTTIRTTLDVYGGLLEGVESDVIDRLGAGDNPQTTPKHA